MTNLHKVDPFRGHLTFQALGVRGAKTQAALLGAFRQQIVELA